MNQIKNQLLIILSIGAALLFTACYSEEPPVVEEKPPSHLTVDDHDDYYTYAGEPESVDYPNPIHVLYNSGYVSGYDEVRGIPAWVAYRVFSVDEYLTFDRPSRFLIDIRTENQISHDDYTHSGFDRGHLAPNFAVVTRYGQEAQIESFLMTNIVPQKPALNRQWWERLERLIARDYSEAYDNVWVLLGPVFNDTGNWLQGNKVKVPTHYYKIIKAEKNGVFEMKAFLVHQDVESGESHEIYLTAVKDIEGLTGLNFNPLLIPTLADSLESQKAEWMW